MIPKRRAVDSSARASEAVVESGNISCMKTYRHLSPLLLALALAACATPQRAPELPAEAVEPAAAATPEQQDEVDIDWPDVAAFMEKATAGNGAQVAAPDADGVRLKIPDAEGFDSGGARITAQFAKTLDGLAKTLGAYPALHAHIVGHTDSVGREGYNMTLSRERALAVAAHLVNSAGIAATRLHAAGAGEREPVADNDTEAGRQANRRVEIYLYLPE